MKILKHSRQRIKRPIDLRGDGTILVPLTKGKSTIVDAVSLSVVQARNWWLMSDGRGHSYAVTAVCDGYSSKHIFLHKVLCGASDEQIVDHANGDTLDNRLSNLRICDARQNRANSNSVGSTSGLRGVWFDKARKKFVAYIGVDGKQRTLGRFDDSTSAAQAYDVAAIEAFGEFARLNFPRSA